jgi:hypothetical protein
MNSTVYWDETHQNRKCMPDRVVLQGRTAKITGQSQSLNVGWQRQGRRPWRWSWAWENRHRQAARLCHNSRISRSTPILRPESRVRRAQTGQNVDCDTASALDAATRCAIRLCVGPGQNHGALGGAGSRNRLSRGDLASRRGAMGTTLKKCEKGCLLCCIRRPRPV